MLRIGSSMDSKSAYIMSGTLNWNCPSEYCTIGFLCGIITFTDSLFIQESKSSSMELSSINPCKQFLQKYSFPLCLVFLLDSNLLRDLIAT